MATPDTRSSLVLVKSFIFKGATQLWSNRYHYTGPEAMTLTKFNVFADLVIADEQAALADTVVIVRAIWNDASTATTSNPHGLATFMKDVSAGGSINGTGYVQVPGDCATFIRYSTDARDSRNHPIYLYNYYHGIRYASGGSQDTLGSIYKTALEEYGDDQIAGWSDGSDTRVRCGPRGAVAQLRHVPSMITHRDFPR